MKVSTKIALASLVIALMSALPAGASVMVGDQMYFGNWNGGKFTAYPEPGSTFTPFVTFCAKPEGTIQVNSGAGYAYKVVAIDTSNNLAEPKVLTDHVAWLYTAYMDGTLSNDFAVQYGIWKSLGYTDEQLAAHSCNTSGRDFYNNPANGMIDTPASWSGLGNVRIAQITDLNGNPAQDILVQVPEPATMSLLALGGLAGLIRRRK